MTPMNKAIALILLGAVALLAIGIANNNDCDGMTRAECFERYRSGDNR